MSKQRVKIACFDFTGCEGCQLAKVNLEDELVPLLNFVEFVQFREAMDPVSDDYAIAFIEGSISTVECVQRIRTIRKKAAVLVTVGSCSTYGGLQALRNGRPLDQVVGEGYPGMQTGHLRSLPWSLPVGKVVKVDYAIPGCPMDKHEFVRVVQALLVGKTPVVPNYAVCVECKRKENECVYDLGYTCMGPVIRAGCGARCPSVNSPCIGCRGFVSDLNQNAQKDVLAQHGLTAEDILNKFRWFCAYPELDGKDHEIQAALAQVPEEA
jgi:coenzyme F420-reducing hydrogenase gamma subunit